MMNYFQYDGSGLSQDLFIWNKWSLYAWMRAKMTSKSSHSYLIEHQWRIFSISVCFFMTIIKTSNERLSFGKMAIYPSIRVASTLELFWHNAVAKHFNSKFCWVFFFSIYYQSRWPETLKNTFELWECIQSFLPIVITATGNCPQQIHCLFLFE